MNFFAPLITAVVTTILICCSSLHADQKGLKLSLISETNTITPGKPLTLGVHIQHEQGFHTYWKNPGIVGMATQLDWTLPEGFSVSDIQWPYPEKCFMAEYPCHGYERDVTLLVTVTPPATINSESVTLETSASWMCCAKECFPGTAKLKISLKVDDVPTPDTAGSNLIQRAKKEIPQPNSDWNASILSKQGAPEIKVLISPPQNTIPKTIYLFSEDGQISSDQMQKISHQKDGKILITVPRSRLDDINSPNLPLILKADAQYVSINPVYKILHSK